MRLAALARLMLEIVVALTLSVCIVSGCGSGPGEKKPPAGTAAVSSVKKSEGISVTLRSQPRVAKPGGAFSLTLDVRNLSGDAREFTLPTSQTYDFLSSAEDGSEVWRMSKGMMFAQVVTPMKMAAGESRVFKAAWNTEEAAAGKYRIQGYFLGMEDLRPSVIVEIKP